MTITRVKQNKKVKKPIKKIKKSIKKVKKQKGGNNFLKFDINNKEIQIFGVNHNESNITIDTIRKVADYANKKRNVCYLLELDYKIKKNHIKNVKKTDFTTKKIMPYIKNAYLDTYDNVCIRGWDIRQSLITQYYQDMLYHKPIELTLGEILENYIKKIPKNKEIKGNYNKKYLEYINNEYKQKINTTLYVTEIFDWIFINYIQKNKLEKTWSFIKLKDIKIKNVNDLINELRNLFMRLSDLYILEKILEQNNTNYILFVGQAHLDNLTAHLKALKIIL